MKAKQTAVVLLLSALSSVFAGAQLSGPNTVTLLFTNDFESAYDPIDAFWRDDIERIGGIAELATLVDSIRESRPAVFLFDAGDIFTGSLARRTAGAVSLDLMQLLRYDAMAIGNHEFEYGWKAFAREKARAPFPVLGANLFYAGTDHPYAQPWTIIERDGVRIAVIGILGQDAATALIPSNIAGLEVRDPTEVLPPLVSQLRREVNLVVLLIHQGPTAPMQTDDEADPSVFRGNQENLELAAKVPGIDVILAGHTDAGTPEPLVSRETGTRVMQTWGQGQHLGELQIELNGDGSIASSSGRLISVDADRYPPDPQVAAALARWRSKHPDLQEVVGHTKHAVVRRYYEESPLGNLFADVLREATATEIALMPSGALRRDLPAGDIRRVDLLDAFPFEDHNAVVSLRGRVLKQILEQGFSLERGLLQVSGVEVIYDPRAAKGSRVRDVCLNGRALDSDQLYRVATLEILAQGGDAYRQFLEAETTSILPQRFAGTLEQAFSRSESIDIPRRKRLYKTQGEDANIKLGSGGGLSCQALALERKKAA